ncbi:MAG: flagellar M-ring protein FliF, partial [Candidatus Marinimicrobia bacterium]|nr:flagellar M-ring protein FliF [Candidatus Neomarinimicrobiota bacterium]
MNSIFVQLGRVLGRYSIGQRIIIISVILGVFSAAISMVFWANRPEYDIMYTDLEPSNASVIVSELRGMKVPFKLENNGRNIYVPHKQVAELRLRFSELGYANEMVAGYEIFDDSKIGMTTFMQNLNMRRALEGELVKTINQFPEIRNSRIHLVMPEDKLFEKDRKGSASVVLYLRAGRAITMDQIDGISALVANSVKGIDGDNVVIIDSEGNLLSNAVDDTNMMGAAGTQSDLRYREELKIQKKVTDIVENIVGHQNTVVRVSIEMNFEQVERNSETPDPESVVVVSEETRTETTTNRDSLNNSNEERQNENTITNYEIGTIQEHYIGNTATIDKLSVAVLINGRKKTVTDADG